MPLCKAEDLEDFKGALHTVDPQECAAVKLAKIYSNSRHYFGSFVNKRIPFGQTTTRLAFYEGEHCKEIIKYQKKAV